MRRIRFHEQLESRHLLTVELVPQALVEIEAEDPRAVIAADLDADGDQDIIVASSGDNRVAWFENLDGLGQYGESRVIADDARSVRGVFAADLDGDGDLDVLSASAADDKIAWYENDGTGQFSAPRVLTTDANGASSVFAADLDGDGDHDVLAASSTDDTVAWFENLDSQGQFSEARLITTTSDRVRSVMAIDLDGDGDADVLTASSGDDSIAWYENQSGKGDFAEASFISRDARRATFVTAADVDDDGDVDVFSAGTSHQITFYENVGGTFFEEEVSTDALGVASLSLTDMDLDGDLDVLAAFADEDVIGWHENLGFARFGEQREVVTSNAKFASFAYAADLNGDKRVDVVSASRDDNKIAWFEHGENDGEFLPEQLITAAAEGASHIAVADVDGDGHPDVLSAFENTVAWYRNADGSGEFESLQVISDFVPGASWVGSADLDGDDDVDVLAISSFDDHVGWFENLGGGSFGAFQTITIDTGNSGDIFATDFDGDDDLDILAASGVRKIALYENVDGEGTFFPRGVAPWSVQSLVAYAADLDQDGFVDLITSDEQGLMWHPNEDGSGTFQFFPFSINVESKNATSIVAVDMDGDFDVDVLTALPQEGLVAWHENVGNGAFGFRREISFDLVGVDSVSTADIDGDGDFDIVAASSVQNELAWFEHLDGKGEFGPAQFISNEAQNARALSLTDVDADGDPDLLSASWLAAINGEIVWYENRLQADIDDDGQVGFSDFVILSQHFGLQNATAEQGDLDDDGQVSFTDFILLSLNFGAKRVAAVEAAFASP